MGDKEYEIESGNTGAKTVASSIKVKIKPQIPVIHIDVIKPLEKKTPNVIEALMEGRVTGKNVCYDYFIIQWIKGYERVNKNKADGSVEHLYLSGAKYNKKEFKFDNWEIDAPPGQVAYPFQDNTLGDDEISFWDVPGYNNYKLPRVGTLEFKLDFIVNVYKWADFGEDLKRSQFPSPTNPKPVVSKEWKLHSTW